MAIQIKLLLWDITLEEDYNKRWFLTATPYPVLIVLAIYLIFVVKIGPRYMNYRDPFNLKTLLFFYNIIQIILSIYFLSLCVLFMLKHGIFYRKCITESTERLREYEYLAPIFLLIKILDLLDTVFFVLRKKQNQVTFLHLHHHVAMVFGLWLAITYGLNPHGVLLGALNSFVHSVMYLYYFLSAIPGMKKYLWWKKYLTMLQLIQFGIVLAYLANSYIISACPFGGVMIYYTYTNVCVFAYQFTKFYITNYIIEKRKKI